MRWTLFLFVVFLSSCQFHTTCDERIKGLYPQSTIETIDIGDDMVLYWRNREQFVLCDYGHSQLVIRTLTAKPWDEAYCKQFTDPAVCKERLEKGTWL